MLQLKVSLCVTLTHAVAVCGAVLGVRCGCRGVDHDEDGADLGSEIASGVIASNAGSQDFGGLWC